MSPDILLTVAITVFALMFTGLVLTYREFKEGAPKKQRKGQEELQNSPHGKIK